MAKNDVFIKNYIHLIMKTKLLLLLTLLVSAFSWGQAFTATYAFDSVTTSSGPTDPTAVPTATGATFSSFNAVGTPTNSNSAGRFSFLDWSTGATTGSDVFTGAINTSEYYQVTITPASGYTIDINSITFTLQRSGTGIRQYAVRSSLDYTTNLPASISPANTNLSVVATNIFQVVDASTVANNGSTITLDSSYDALSSAVTFRFYGWNAEATGGTFSIDNVIINGVATAVPTCAAPTMSSTVSATQNVTGDIDFTGSVTDAGGGTNITTRGFQISTSNAMTTPTDLSEASTATGGYSLNTILNGNTRYYYRAYAINDCTPAQTGYSSATPVATSIVTKQFSTTANAATNISSSSFTANWTNPGGGTETYTYKLYVTVDDGTGTFIPFATHTAISSATPYYDLTGLTPNTRYRYYFHSNNSAGDSELPSNTIEVITLAPGSDIVVNSSYAYTSNIDYKLYQVATISNTSHSIGVFQFIIRDGGSSALTDSKTTELNAISFNVTNISNIRTAALFFGNTLINASPSITGSSISFSGLSGTDVTALDGSTKSITLRVTFNTIVTDNQQMQFTIASATANTSGTIFDASNAGGATSSITGDRNRIEVTADRLLFVQQPVNTSQNAPMGTAPTVKACDSISPLYGNVDLDYTTAISITSTGTMTGAPISVIPTTGTGVSTFTGIVHTSAGTYTLNATSGTLTTTNSNNFVISPFTFAAGDMRPLYDGTDFSFNGSWEYYNGTTWLTVAGSGWDGRAPQSTTTTINRILIDKLYITAGGSSSKAYNCDFIIQSNGELFIVDDDNPPVAAQMLAAGKKIEVLSGGKLFIEGDIDVATTANLIVRNGGEMIINQSSIDFYHPMWDGAEKFESGSTVTINNWRFTGAGSGSLFNVGGNTISNNDNGYKFGNLIIDINPSFSWSIVGGDLGIINLCENDFEIFNASTNFIFGATNRTGTNGFLVNGNMTIYDGPFSFGFSFTNDSFNHQFIINGNFECGSNDILKIHHVESGTPTALNGNVTFKGDVKIASTVTSFANDGASGTPARMSVNFENGTLALPKLIDIAPTSVAIPMNIKAGSVRKLATQDLTTNSVTSYTAPFTVETNGTLHFGWANDGTTPLVIKKTASSPAGTNTFISQSSSTLISTSLDGLQQASATTGNVQYTSSNKTFNQTGTFWYVGKNDQATGDVFTSGGSAKTIICDLLDNTKKLTLNSSTSITSPGLLDIRKGQFVETTTALITGSNGGLTMEIGTHYIIPSLSSSSTDLIPRMSGLSLAYNLASNSTIELNGADGINDFDQYLRGNYNYRNLTFSTSGTKTISDATPSVTGTITVANAAILDVEDNTMGGTGTSLTMTGTSEYKTAGINVKPDATGTYTLGIGTKVTFTSGSTATPILTLQRIRLEPDYYNIDVVGNNVGTNTLTSPIKTRGTFKVKTNGLFKHSNTDGFNGSSTTAIDNTNSPTITLEDNSTIEYAGANQTITHFSPAYRNLHISGSGNKTLQVDFDTRVNENLEVLAGNTATLLIEEGKVITVKEAVKVPNSGDAKLEIKDNGQLIQIDDTNPLNLNSGENFYMERKADVTTNDYVYWSSPTDNYSVTLIPNSSLRYEWNPIKYNSNGTQGNWIAASSTMAKGKGYIVRVPPSATPSEITTNFKGTPRNGTVTVDIFRGNRLVDGTNVTRFDDNWNLVGNPYPSAISALEFLQTNGANLVDTDPSTPTPTVPATTIVGAVWIWKHGIDLSSGNQDPFYYNFANNYSSTDYIKFNGTGSTDPSFNGFIGAGQGFMISMKDNPGVNPNDDDEVLPTTLSGIYKPYKNTVVFTNSMRVKDDESSYDNTQFFRTANAENSVAASDEKHRIWLDIIKTSNGQTDTALIGYVSNATMGEDNLYDTFFMPRNEVSLYSLINTKSYIIQGRSLPFDTTDLVPLGMKIISAGNHTIAIRQVDGIFEGNQNIYLEDKQLNIIHDLKQSPYHFTAPTGINNTRFVLRYTTNALGNADFDYDNQVIVFSKNNTVTINSSIQNIDEVQVYDVLGRQLYQKASVENQEHSFAKDIAQQTVIVKVKLQNGIWVTKKVLVK